MSSMPHDGIVSPTREIIAHISATGFADLPSDAVAATKRRVIDLVGCALAGARASGNDKLRSVLSGQGSSGQASLFHENGRMNAADAAMANAIAARSFDFEVMATVVAGRVIPSHTSPTTVMTAFAVAEREDATGAEFLTALTLGDDLVARVLGAAGFDFDDGWDASSIHSALGASAIAGKLAGLDEQGISDTLGMVVNLVGGTIQAPWDGSTDFKLPQGMAARHAVLCADLARAGWTGMTDALLAPFGFYHQFTPGCAHPELLTAGLGQSFYAEEYFKPYPACAATHSAIECALELREEAGFAPERIERVVLKLPPPLLSGFCVKPYEPRRFPHCDAIFSFRFQVANALLNGTTRQAHYEEARLRDPALVEFTRLIDLEPLDVTVESYGADGPCLIVAELKTGGRVAHRLEKLSRYPTVRASTDAEIEDKFRAQCAFSGKVDECGAESIIEQIRALEDCPSIRGFVELATGLRR